PARMSPACSTTSTSTATSCSHTTRGRASGSWTACNFPPTSRGSVSRTRYLILAEGFSGNPHYGKTMRGVLRYRRDDVVAVLASIVLTVGSDCAIGKMTVALELDLEARRRGVRSVFVPTGQTGMAIAGWGIAVDAVVADFIAGAAERLVVEGAARGGDLLW